MLKALFAPADAETDEVISNDNRFDLTLFLLEYLNDSFCHRCWLKEFFSVLSGMKKAIRTHDSVDIFNIQRQSIGEDGV